MLIRTHLAITLFFALIFIDLINHKTIFLLVALVATFIPDVDSRFSTLGRRKTARILQFFTKHRGFIHSFTFLFLIVLFFISFFPILAFPFFLGYGLHLFLDAFTPEGIKPFYPWKKKSTGWIRTGSRSEILLFVVFIVGDLFLAFLKIFLS